MLNLIDCTDDPTVTLEDLLLDAVAELHAAELPTLANAVLIARRRLVNAPPESGTQLVAQVASHG